MPAIPDPKQRLVDAFALCLQIQIPVLLVGRPGEGKTASARAIAKALGWPIHVLPIPGKRDPAQVVGLPKNFGEIVRWVPYDWILELQKAARAIVFLDDLAEADRSMQSFFLEIVHGRRLGEVVLENASMAAAANPDDGHLDITPALANRLVHLHWRISPEEFAADLASDFPAPKVPILEPTWVEHRGIWRRAVAEYIRTIPDIRKPDPVGEEIPEEAGPFPSQRTWDYSASLLAASGSLGLGDVEEKHLQVLLLRGAVGAPAANSFFTWYAGKSLPKPEDLLGRPALLSGREFSNRPDATWIAVLSVLRYTLFRIDQPEVWDGAWRFLDHLAEIGQVHFGVNAARILHQRRPEARMGQTIDNMRHYSRLFVTTDAKQGG